MSTIIKCDKRGQLVIPKKVRKELGLDGESAFWIFTVEDGIFLKKVDSPKVSDIKKSLRKL